MAARDDITIDWTSSPRVLTVLAPSTSLTIQELIDTCRYLEAQPVAMSEDYLIDAYGKQQLDVGLYVGMTAVLRNTVISFEARPGPTWAKCKIKGGNIVALDENGVPMEPVLEEPYTSVVTELSTSAALIAGAEPPAPSEIAQAVWDEVMAAHTTGGTAAAVLKLAQALAAKAATS